MTLLATTTTPCPCCQQPPVAPPSCPQVDTLHGTFWSYSTATTIYGVIEMPGDGVAWEGGGYLHGSDGVDRFVNIRFRQNYPAFGQEVLYTSGCDTDTLSFTSIFDTETLQGCPLVWSYGPFGSTLDHVQPWYFEGCMGGSGTTATLGMLTLARPTVEIKNYQSFLNGKTATLVVQNGPKAGTYTATWSPASGGDYLVQFSLPSSTLVKVYHGNSSAFAVYMANIGMTRYADLVTKPTPTTFRCEWFNENTILNSTSLSTTMPVILTT